MKSGTLIIFILMALIAACSKEEFAKSNDTTQLSKDNTNDVPPSDVPIDTVIQEAKLECEQARNDNKVKVLGIPVLFPQTIECDWGNNGNLSRLNQFVRARNEQGLTINLPNYKRLCDVKFTFPEQTMNYDDEIYLLFENIIVMGSADYSKNATKFTSDGLNVSNGLVQYKWEGPNGLLNKPYDHNISPKYCLGLDSSSFKDANKCQIPFTQTTGQMVLDIPQDEILRLLYLKGWKIDSESTDQPSEINLGFVTLGDNDNGDCRHYDFKLTMSLYYIE